MLSFAKCAPILGVALFTSFTSLTSLQDPKPTPPPVPPPLHLALTSLTPDATLAIGGDRQITASGDAIWISSRTAGTLTRVDAKTNTLGTPLTVGHEPCLSVVSAFGSLWTPLCGTKGLARTPVPPAADKAEAKEKTEGPEKAGSTKSPVIISVGIRSAGPAVSGASSLWMITDASGTLSRIDPDTNAVVAEITVAAGSSAMTFGDDSIWLTSDSKDVLTRVNGDTNVVLETIKVGHAPVAVATGVGSIWTLNGGDGTISRVDPKTNKVTQTIKTGVTSKSGAIAVGEGSVWISAPGFPLTRIDPVTNTLAQQFTGPGGGALAIGQKSLWIAATPTAVWRVDPRRVEATRK